MFKHNYEWKKCIICGKEIFTLKRRKTCSHKCSLKYNDIYYKPYNENKKLYSKRYKEIQKLKNHFL